MVHIELSSSACIKHQTWTNPPPRKLGPVVGTPKYRAKKKSSVPLTGRLSTNKKVLDPFQLTPLLYSQKLTPSTLWEAISGFQIVPALKLLKEPVSK